MPEPGGEWLACRCQAVRSVGYWSTGRGPESSFCESLSALIEGAERFLYLENSSFVTSCVTDTNRDQLAFEALCSWAVRVAKGSEGDERERQQGLMIVRDMSLPRNTEAPEFFFPKHQSVGSS